MSIPGFCNGILFILYVLTIMAIAISPSEAAGAFQLRYLTTCDCKEIRKTQDDMLARVRRGEQDMLMELGAAFQLTELAACGKQNN